MSMSLKKAVELLEADGVVIPEPYLKYVKAQDRIKRGVSQVWKCRSCHKEHETPLPVKSLGCSCGASTRKIWPK